MSCWAGWSSVNCWTRRSSRPPSSSCSALRRTAVPAAWKAWLTCCGCWVRWHPRKSPPGWNRPRWLSLSKPRWLSPPKPVEPAETRRLSPPKPRMPTPPWPAAHLAALQRANRAIKVNIGGAERFAAVEDAARLRDAIGVPLPMGVPLAFIEPVADPLGDLVSRYARTHGPFTASEAAARLGLGVAVVGTALKRLAADGRVVEGEFRPHAAPARDSPPIDGPAGRSSSRQNPPRRTLPRPPPANGATPKSSASSAVGRWRHCAPKWNRWTPPPTAGSCPPGSTSGRPAPAAASRRCAGWTASSPPSTSCPGCPFRRRPGNRWCWPAGFPTTSPPCWTS